MRREILFSDLGGESWAALLEEGRVCEVAVERPSEEARVGDVWLGVVRRVLPGMQAAFIDIGTERALFLHAADVGPGGKALRGGTSSVPQAPIGSLLAEGGRVVVQLVKRTQPGKGARVTTNLSLPGRWLVFSPGDGHIGVSRRISDPAQRERLERAVSGFAREAESWIVRTAAAGVPSDDLRAEAERLRADHEAILVTARTADAPARLRREEDLLGRLLRDLDAEGLEAIVVEGGAALERCRRELRGTFPELLDRLRGHEGPVPLMESRRVPEEIERSLAPTVRLPSGGTIVVTPTEAFVAVDVNTGRFPGAEDPEETALATNIEAAGEIARLLRLRDLGGIVVIDFIDMAEDASRRRLLEELARLTAGDRSCLRLLPVNEFGLVHMIRRRRRPPLDNMLREACFACSGSGQQRSAESLYHEIRRALLRLPPGARASRLQVRVHPSVARWLERAGLDLKAGGGAGDLPLAVSLETDASLPPGRFELSVAQP